MPLTADRVATGYGQPPSTFYDWTLSQSSASDNGFKLPLDAEARLMIEKFSNKVTKALYSNTSDPVGLVTDDIRSHMSEIFAREYVDLEHTVQLFDASRTFPIIYLPFIHHHFHSIAKP